MKRIFLLLLVGLGVALIIPDSRAVILERAAPLANPAYKWMASQEMSQIVDDLETRQGTGDGLPVQRGAFEEWLRSRYRDERFHTDPWGTPYGLQAQGRQFQVVSAGPDQVFGTDDDIFREGGGDS